VRARSTGATSEAFVSKVMVFDKPR
jgi:hypothetical protein